MNTFSAAADVWRGPRLNESTTQKTSLRRSISNPKKLFQVNGCRKKLTKRNFVLIRSYYYNTSPLRPWIRGGIKKESEKFFFFFRRVCGSVCVGGGEKNRIGLQGEEGGRACNFNEDLWGRGGDVLLCFLVACAAAALGWGGGKRSLAPPKGETVFTQPPSKLT